MKWTVHWLIKITDRLEIMVAALLLILWMMSIHDLYIDYWLIYFSWAQYFLPLSQIFLFLGSDLDPLVQRWFFQPSNRTWVPLSQTDKGEPEPCRENASNEPCTDGIPPQGCSVGKTKRSNVLMDWKLEEHLKMTAVTESSQILKRSEHKKQTHQDYMEGTISHNLYVEQCHTSSQIL